MFKTRLSFWVFAAGLAMWLSGASAAAAAPRRIISFNVCADQLVLALADNEQIAGLSPYAADPALSVVASRAKNFRALDWSAESVVDLAPDLVLVGPTDRPTQALLAAMKVKIANVDLVADMPSARAQIRSMAALVGHAERGEQLIAELDRALERLAEATRAKPRSALVVERGGYASGPRSLVAAMLEAASLTPPQRAPRGFGGFLSLEDLLAIHPDLLILKDPPEVAADQGALFLTHPALKALYPAEKRIALPTRYALCGGSALVEGLNYLADTIAKNAVQTR